VLCYLEGLTAEEAARQLGWPAGTVRSRLARGRDRLHARLVRRGLAPSAAGLVATLASRAAWASVPVKLLNETARMATFAVAGRMAAGAVPASILTLTEGVLIEMAIAKWKMAGLALLVASVLASGAMVSAQGPPGQGGSPSESDRLKAVEEKLDRIVRALEGSNRTTSAANPNLINLDAGGNPAAPPLQANPLPEPSQLSPGTTPLPNDLRAQVRPTRRDSGEFTVRDRLERRVAELEDRLTRVEQLLGSASAGKRP
jgi:hypothetical protein